MIRFRKIALAAALPLLVAAGCSDFLTDEETQNDPNRATQATIDQLFVAAQAATFVVQTGEGARAVSMWMQQMSGTDRQYQTLGTYTHGEGTFGTPWTYIFGGGGLVDLRRIQAEATAINDRRYTGIAQVLEALQVSTAADIWGDIPYSEAINPEIATPKLDEQLEVYAALQTLLDAAIANLASGAGAGPGTKDLVYSGNATKWIQLAHTLKARLYMHVAEVDASAYAKAAAEAAQGISSHANDYTTVHAGTAGEQNLWYQFTQIQRTEYISPGEYLVELMKSRSDPRLDEYFVPGSTGEVIGAAPGDGYTGAIAELSAERGGAGGAASPQPIVTYDENALIWAEAAYKAGDPVTALAKLNEVRTHHGLSAVSLSGTALFQEIMLEKYISLFQSLEVWNDWKRTCIPDLTPALGAAIIPARFFYPVDERQTNTNIPDVASQPLRNDNDPANAGCNSQN